MYDMLTAQTRKTYFENVDVFLQYQSDYDIYNYMCTVIINIDLIIIIILHYLYYYALTNVS